MFEQILVALIVVAAALFAIWRLPGSATRLRYVALLRRAGLGWVAGRLERRVLRSIAGGGCAACGSATRQATHGRTAPRPRP